MEDIGFMEHTEVSRTLIDRILGRNKDIDKIIKVRKQIITIKKSFDNSKLFRKLSYSSTDGIHQKYFTLTTNSVQDEKLIYMNLGGEVLLKRLTETRDDLIELLKDVIDVSDIQKEIREDKLKSIGI
jgi:hypothetical protein